VKNFLISLAVPVAEIVKQRSGVCLSVDSVRFAVDLCGHDLISSAPRRAGPSATADTCTSTVIARDIERLIRLLS